MGIIRQFARARRFSTRVTFTFAVTAPILAVELAEVWEMTEFRIALRSLLRSPGFTLAAVATLTLASFAPNRSGEGNRHVVF